MARIIYVTHDNQRFEHDAENGSSVMEAAVRAGVPGIEAECGGACACATCHVYVEPEFMNTGHEAALRKCLRLRSSAQADAAQTSHANRRHLL